MYALSEQNINIFHFLSYLMDSNQSGNQLHQHDFHLKALFRVFQLFQQFLRKILMKRDYFSFSISNTTRQSAWIILCQLTLRVMNEVNGWEVEHFWFLLFLVFLSNKSYNKTKYNETQIKN